MNRFGCVGLASVVALFIGLQLHLLSNSQTYTLGHGYCYLWMGASTETGRRVPPGGIIMPDATGKQRILSRGGDDPNFHRGEVGPHVDRYRVFDRVIVGQVEEWAGDVVYPGYYERNAGTRPGYFVVDVHADQAYSGLTKRQWLGLLHRYGIDTAPELFKASLCDPYIGLNRPDRYR